MEIVYCDDCGIRIPTNQVTQGVTDDGKIQCEKCRPSAVPLPALTPVAKRPSGDGLPAASHLNLNPNPQHEFGAAQYTGAATGPTPPRAHRKTTGPVARQPANDKAQGRSAPASGENNMMIGLGIGGAFVMLVGLVFMFSGDKAEKKTAQSTATSTATDTAADASRRTATETSTSTRPATKIDDLAATPLVTTPLAPLTPAAPKTESPAAPSQTFSGGAANPNSKTDPDAIAQSAYDKVLAKIAKEEPAGKIAQLELFVKDVDPNTMAASRARAMLSGLKKADELSKAPPPPPPPPAPVAPVAPATPATPGSSVFKEDFETTAYGINFGAVASSLPGGRPGKALKTGVKNDGNDGRGGIYTYAYPETSPAFKTQTLALTSSGMRLRLKYFITANALDLVVGYVPEGKEMIICKNTNRAPKKGVWTEVDIPLADFKHDAADAKIPDGSHICRLEFWAYGAGECFIDDVELVAGQ